MYIYVYNQCLHTIYKLHMYMWLFSLKQWGMKESHPVGDPVWRDVIYNSLTHARLNDTEKKNKTKFYRWNEMKWSQNKTVGIKCMNARPIKGFRDTTNDKQSWKDSLQLQLWL